MTSPVWDPHQYARHSGHRNRPITDLLARVPALPHDEAPRIADLGCGPGGPSTMLADRWPRAHITGYDNSPAMLREAGAHAGRTPAGGSLEFTHLDLATWRPARGERFDLIFSNAALQWVLAGSGKNRVHPVGEEGRGLPGEGGPGGAPGGTGQDGALTDTGFFRTWTAVLPAGGVLAFQVPGNFDAPSHTLLLELRNSPRWRARLGAGARGGSVRSPAEHLAELEPLGCDVDAWETTYAQLLHGEDPVLDWVKGTALRPVLTLLADDPEAESAFLAEYGQLLREAYPPLGGDPARGTVFPFRRIFVVAVKR
ncbi:methyltransferase domain-containing protein [Streptomyces sp. WMMB 322]|uniref:methyltransferase domain-containing protein n=1 Tax=Streptomyces sp. WMMB 322 TaxID=1286821 RepID=UPI0008237FE2|nr:methyltransferase domain-containing protein [Streptomyces sp. WMMB 322]SCK10382.1 trans-aconitate 2-methyltransferase [Streptomyces sp. WMMB 322]